MDSVPMRRNGLKRILDVVAMAGCLALGLAGPAAAQDNFYAGKTINLVVGAGPGGTYDLYARALAAAMPKHIPGSPTIIVQNMNAPLPMANHVYNVAAKDGTSIAVGANTFISYQILGGPNANFDPEKIAWLGRLTNTNGLYLTWHTSGVKTIEDAKAKEIPWGTTGATLSYALLANELLGTRFKIVPGYVSEELDGALERGEVGGHSRSGVDRLFNRDFAWYNDKKINLLMQSGDKRDPRLPDVPTFRELVANEADRQLVDIVTLASDFGQSFWVSPEVPADRLAILREAFRKTVEEPEFKAIMEKFGTTVRYETPDYLAARVTATAAVPADVKARAAKIILPK